MRYLLALLLLAGCAPADPPLLIDGDNKAAAAEENGSAEDTRK